MGHNRKLIVNAADLTGARFPAKKLAVHVLGDVADELEPVIISTGYLEGAPFRWVLISLELGLKNDSEPRYGKISKKYGDLTMMIELDTHEMLDADREELKRLFRIATLKTLVHIGKKYNLPYDEFQLSLDQATADV